MERHAISTATSLRAFVRHIIHAPSTLLSINKIYNDFKSRGITCGKNSLHEWLDHLCDSYLTYIIPITSRSERIRQVNPKKVYLIDTGLLTAVTANINGDKGALLENLVFIQLRRKGFLIEYYQNTKKYEVDFVVRDPINGNILKLIQVTWSLENLETTKREVRGLIAAMEELNFPEGLIITWEDRAPNLEQKNIHTLPLWRWLISSAL